jgi:acyl-CoA thioester hydrolase
MYTYFISPKFGDIDGLGHVNNTVIPSWFEQARNYLYKLFNPELDLKTWNLILARFEIDFVSQMYYSKDVEIRTYVSKIGRSSFEVYQEAWQSGHICVKGKTVLVHFDFIEQKSAIIPEDIREKLSEHLIAAIDATAN